MSFRGGDFSTGTTGNFQPELTLTPPLRKDASLQFSQRAPEVRIRAVLRWTTLVLG